jgi:hypothetical protein
MVHGWGWASTKVHPVLARVWGRFEREPIREWLTMFGLEFRRKPVSSRVNLGTKLTTRTMGTASFIPDTVCTEEEDRWNFGCRSRNECPHKAPEMGTIR